MRKVMSKSEQDIWDIILKRHFWSVDCIIDGPRIEEPTHKVDEEAKKNGELIVNTLQQFKINATLEKILQGATVTRYEFSVTETEDIKRRIANCNVALAHHLDISEDIRIEAPILGRSAVAIEVPNKIKKQIHYHEFMESNEFSNTNSYASVVIGKNIKNQFVFWDMKKQSSLLLVGVNDSGKTNLLHCMICNILQKFTPEEVKIVLVDATDEEFGIYKNIPYLLDNSIVSEPQHILDLFDFIIRKARERYAMFQDNCAYDIFQYNASDAVKNGERLPHIIIFFDNFEKLIGYSKIDELVRKIWYLTDLGYAGIHIVLSTEPLPNNLTIRIRDGFRGRLIFQVGSALEAGILDGWNGAEKLLGEGDVLYLPNGRVDQRLQTLLIPKQEIADIIWAKDKINNYKR